jgi:hypothetical protein
LARRPGRSRIDGCAPSTAISVMMNP